MPATSPSFELTATNTENQPASASIHLTMFFKRTEQSARPCRLPALRFVERSTVVHLAGAREQNRHAGDQDGDSHQRNCVGYHGLTRGAHDRNATAGNITQIATSAARPQANESGPTGVTVPNVLWLTPTQVTALSFSTMPALPAAPAQAFPAAGSLNRQRRPAANDMSRWQTWLGMAIGLMAGLAILGLIAPSSRHLPPCGPILSECDGHSSVSWSCNMITPRKKWSPPRIATSCASSAMT